MTENIFEQASRCKLRFETTKGLLTVEDLWDLPLSSSNGVCLDSIAKVLNKQLSDNEVSFVHQQSKQSKLVSLKFEIVKYIINTRLNEAKINEEKVVKQSKLNQINELLKKREDDKLNEMSIEDLMKLKESLL